MSKKDQKIFPLVRRLWKCISLQRKRQCGIVFVLTILASLTEIISIGAIFPFLGALLNPEKIFINQYIQPLIRLFNIQSSAELLLPLTITFGVTAILAGGLRLLLVWTTTKLSFAMGADLGYGIYRSTLYQTYSEHIKRNSSEIIDAIQNKTNAVIYMVLIPFLNLMSAFVMLMLVLTVLFILNPYITIITLLCFGSIYLLVIWFAKRTLVINGEKISLKSVEILKNLQIGFGGIRDILLDSNQEYYLKKFQSTDIQLRESQASSTYIGSFPRYFLETFGLVVLAAIAYFLSGSEGGIGGVIPLLGVAALGAQKLLPILQQAYSAWANMKVGRASLLEVLAYFHDQVSAAHLAKNDVARIDFKEKIKFDNVYFSYTGDEPWVLKQINLEITKGSRVGFIGKTGGGKSTLLDLFMGLLEPSRGLILVDETEITSKNRAQWQKRIAHVPQTIYLADGTIAENIAFGLLPNEIDYERVYEAAVKAQLLPFINELDKKFDAEVGERGVNLSGGQRQRIGIARALYKNADVLIFDEATSALDKETENSVMEAIANLSGDITILMIAHRLSTLNDCHLIFELSGSGIQKV